MRFFLAIIAFVLLRVTTAEAASPVPANGVISTSGDWYLAGNFSNNGADVAIVINANNVNLDLSGKTVACTPPTPATNTPMASTRQIDQALAFGTAASSVA